MKKHIYLIGFMGTGKSTVSKALKNLMEVNEIDLDAAIVKENGMTIPEMFEQFGEKYFRDKETRMLHKIARYHPAIISCGGGTILRDENVDIMRKKGIIVWLTATPETIFERVKDGRNRPLLNGNMNVAYIAQLLESRLPRYQIASDVSVSTDGKKPEEIAAEIINLMNE